MHAKQESSFGLLRWVIFSIKIFGLSQAQFIKDGGNKNQRFLSIEEGAFLEQEDRVELETYNPEGLKAWDWKWFFGSKPLNGYSTLHLEQRKKDPNLTLRVQLVQESENRLARYLAKDGANNRTHLVVYRMMFGRVREFWMLDMGLGINVGDFEVLTEDEYEDYFFEH